MLDWNCSPKLAQIVDQFDDDSDVQHLGKWCGQDTPDETWLRVVAADPAVPVVVSGDMRIVKNRAQAQVLAGLALTFVALAKGWTSLQWDDQVIKLLSVWPAIRKAASQASRPTVFVVPINSLRVDRMCFTDELARRKAPRP